MYPEPSEQGHCHVETQQAGSVDHGFGAQKQLATVSILRPNFPGTRCYAPLGLSCMWQGTILC